MPSALMSTMSSVKAVSSVKAGRRRRPGRRCRSHGGRRRSSTGRSGGEAAAGLRLRQRPAQVRRQMSRRGRGARLRQGECRSAGRRAGWAVWVTMCPTMAATGEDGGKGGRGAARVRGRGIDGGGAASAGRRGLRLGPRRAIRPPRADGADVKVIFVAEAPDATAHIRVNLHHCETAEAPDALLRALVPPCGGGGRDSEAVAAAAAQRAAVTFRTHGLGRGSVSAPSPGPRLA